MVQMTVSTANCVIEIAHDNRIVKKNNVTFDAHKRAINPCGLQCTEKNNLSKQGKTLIGMMCEELPIPVLSPAPIQCPEISLVK